MIKGIAHIAFVVKDMKKTIDFYCNYLGFNKVFTLKNDQGDPWIEFLQIKDGQFIELFYARNNISIKYENNIGYSHLCLEVDDIFKYSDYLKKKGILLSSEITQGRNLNYQFWINDPDGNPIEFMQMDSNSPLSRL